MGQDSILQLRPGQMIDPGPTHVNLDIRTDLDNVQNSSEQACCDQLPLRRYHSAADYEAY